MDFMASSAKPATVSAANFPLDCCVVASGEPAVKNCGRVNHQREAEAVILGGGFNIVLFSPLRGGMIQFWLYNSIFQMGWNHQPLISWCFFA